MFYYKTKNEHGVQLHDAADLSQFDGFYTSAELSQTSENVKIWNEQYQEYDYATAHSLRAGTLKPQFKDLSTLKLKEIYEEIWLRDNFGLVDFSFQNGSDHYTAVIQNTNRGYSVRAHKNGVFIPSFLLSPVASLKTFVAKCGV